MRALVTSSRNTFALDIIRKLGSAGHTVVAADTYAGAIGSHSRYLAGHVTTASPTFETDQFMVDIKAAIEKYDIDTIIPTFEEAFYLSARAHELPANVTLFAGHFSKLARLHDKVSFQRLAGQAGVPVPKTVVATDHESLKAATEEFPEFFARAAFSRGGVGLFTNTGVLAGKVTLDDCHPTPEQPWLVQPFVDGPMICTYSVIIDGKVVAHSTYRAPEQWDHSTGISFLAIDSTATLAHTQAFVDTLDPNFTGQLSFDYVDHHGELYAIECNPRSTNGVFLLETEEFVDALTGASTEVVIAEPGRERQIRLAVLAEAFHEPIKHLPTTLHDVISAPDLGSGWHDSLAMMWSPASLIHGAKMSHGSRKPILSALGADIVWDGEEIKGMTAEDATALEDVHAQRV